MGRTRHEKMRIQNRRMQVAELYMKGWKQAAIARKLGVSQATVSCDIKASRKEWKESRVRDFDEATMEGVRRYDVVILEAWEGYERSKEPAETTRITQKNGEKRAEKTVRGRSGDPRFLQIALRAYEQRCKLLGVDAAATKAFEPPDVAAIRAKAYSIGWDFWHLLIGDHGPPTNVIDDDYIRRFVDEQIESRPDITGK